MATFEENDGGRVAAGFKGMTNDCVCRAIAIAAALPYEDVYKALAARCAAEKPRKGRKPSHPRSGVHRPIYEAYLRDLGFTWVPTMAIGKGCTVHLRASELPKGRIIARMSRHVAAVIDGVLHDTHDSSRDGTRCVYGYFIER